VERVVGRVSREERARIVALLHEHGGNRARVSKISGRGVATVQRIAEAEGIVSEHSAPKKANEARSAFAEADRRQIVLDGFQKARDLLGAITDAAGLQKWSVAVGTLIDKDLLLSGKPTNINENRKGSTLSDLFSGVDEEARREWEASRGDASS
jgi:hypothetical protein